MHFPYGSTETDYLKGKDAHLGRAIEQIGPIRRAVDPDLFSSVVRHIVGQQISTAAQATVWQRLLDKVGLVEAPVLAGLALEDLQKIGITFRKAAYIKEFSEKVVRKEFLLDELAGLDDATAIKQLTSLKGIGVWTAEMILLFGLKRPDVVSFGDLAIKRGMALLYGKPLIDKDLFASYARIYSPYGSVASLYLWAVAGGALEN